MDYVKLLEQFGFPIVVAIWSLWQLRDAWNKNMEFQATISESVESLKDIKDVLDKNTSIQTEILTTLKIFNALLSKNGGVEKC